MGSRLIYCVKFSDRAGIRNFNYQGDIGIMRDSFKCCMNCIEDLIRIPDHESAHRAGLNFNIKFFQLINEGIDG